jgi:nucleotide-binding universal stress UspA family protein
MTTTTNTRHILVPVDLSEISVEAVRAAREIAPEPSRFTLLHVYDFWEEVGPVTLDLTFTTGLPETERNGKIMDYLRQVRERELNGIAEVDVEMVIDRYPAPAICRYARTNGVDLIVLTTHGRTGLSHLVMGSVAEAVVRYAHCPVLVMRPKTQKASQKSA